LLAIRGAARACANRRTRRARYRHPDHAGAGDADAITYFYIVANAHTFADAHINAQPDLLANSHSNAQPDALAHDHANCHSTAADLPHAAAGNPHSLMPRAVHAALDSVVCTL
jgi:hypothetical protein